MEDDYIHKGLLEGIIGKKHTQLAVPLASLQVLNRPNWTDLTRAQILFLLGDHEDMAMRLHHLSPHETLPVIEEENGFAILRDCFESEREQLIQEESQAEAYQHAEVIYMFLDMYKVIKLASGNATWREISVYAAISSSVGQREVRAVPTVTISVRAAGYLKLTEVPPTTHRFSRDQVLRTVRDVKRKQWVFVAYSGRHRANYYSGYRLHGGRNKKAAEEKFLKIIEELEKDRSSHRNTGRVGGGTQQAKGTHYQRRPRKDEPPARNMGASGQLPTSRADRTEDRGGDAPPFGPDMSADGDASGSLQAEPPAVIWDDDLGLCHTKEWFLEHYLHMRESDFAKMPSVVRDGIKYYGYGS